MAEFDIPRIIHLEIHISRGMAARTFFYLKCPLTVVAGAAGFPLSHIRHGVADLFFDVKDGIVAGFAIIAGAFLVDMKIVIEFYLAVITAAKSDILDVYSIGEGKNKDNG